VPLGGQLPISRITGNLDPSAHFSDYSLNQACGDPNILKVEVNFDDLAVIGVGSIAAFVSAAFAVRALLRYVSGHSFKVFAWYRIAFGFLILGTWYFGWVKW